MSDPGVPAIELSDIEKRYQDVVALESLNLGIPDRTFFALLGPSGCGKSTTLKIIAGLERPTAGRVFISGRDMTTVPAYRRPVNTVFQNYAVFPHLDVFENIAFGLRESRTPRREIQTRVREMIELVQLEGRERARAHELSGGQLQRVALARALVNRPSVLLLDEPLAALDFNLRREMRSYLRDLQERTEKTFVHVTHDQEEAFSIASLVGVMSPGVLEQVGSPETIYRQPRSLFVAGFVGGTNRIPGTIERVIGGDRYGVALNNGHRLVTRGVTDLHVGTRIRIIVRPEDVKLTQCRADRQPSEPYVRGVIRSVAFMGSKREVRVDAADAGEFVVQSDRSLHLTKGEDVVASWSADVAWAVPDRVVMDAAMDPDDPQKVESILGPRGVLRSSGWSGSTEEVSS
jgi:spermidine/putrescine transport system ATP-binding protein